MLQINKKQNFHVLWDLFQLISKFIRDTYFFNSLISSFFKSLIISSISNYQWKFRIISKSRKSKDAISEKLLKSIALMILVQEENLRGKKVIDKLLK